MNFLLSVFNEIIFRPLLNALIFLVDIIPGDELGFAIIFLTLVIRFALYPLSYKALKSQKQMSALQPKIKEIQKKYKDDKQKQSEEMMKFYKENDINPFSGCLPFLIQLPILIGLYRVFLSELNGGELTGLYSFVSAPENINNMFLGLVNLTEPSLILAVLAGFSQFILSKMTFSLKKKTGASKNDKPDFQNVMGKQMTYVLPVITVFIAQSFPSGLVLYWLTTTLFSLAQQLIINRKMEEDEGSKDLKQQSASSKNKA